MSAGSQPTHANTTPTRCATIAPVLPSGGGGAAAGPWTPPGAYPWGPGTTGGWALPGGGNPAGGAEYGPAGGGAGGANCGTGGTGGWGPDGPSAPPGPSPGCGPEGPWDRSWGGGSGGVSLMSSLACADVADPGLGSAPRSLVRGRVRGGHEIDQFFDTTQQFRLQVGVGAHRAQDAPPRLGRVGPPAERRQHPLL